MAAVFQVHGARICNDPEPHKKIIELYVRDMGGVEQHVSQTEGISIIKRGGIIYGKLGDEIFAIQICKHEGFEYLKSNKEVHQLDPLHLLAERTHQRIERHPDSRKNLDGSPRSY